MVCGGLLLLIGAGYLGARFSGSSYAVATVSGVTALFGISCLSGPVPLALTCFDISDKSLFVLSCVLLLPYWALLGAAIGFVRGKAQLSSPEQLPVAPAKLDRRAIRRFIEVFAFAFALLLFPFGPLLGSNSGRPRASVRLRILHNLRQIDGAKQQLALDKNLGGDYVPTDAELASYLRRGGDTTAILPVGTERYVINPIGEAPYAVLDSDWRIRRRRWQQGFTITNGTVFKIPGTEVQIKRAP